MERTKVKSSIVETKEMPPKMKFTEGEKVLCFHGPLIYEAKALKSAVCKDKQIKYYIHYSGWNKNWDEWVPESRVLKYNEVNVQRQKEVSKQHNLAAKTAKKTAAKVKKTDTVVPSTVKDSDSRASTPSKDLIKDTAMPAVAATVASVTSASSTSSSTTTTTTTSTSRTRTSKPATPVDSTPIEGPRKKRGRTETSVESEDQFLSRIEIKIKIPDELKPWLVDDWDAITRQNKLVELPAKSTVQNIIDGFIQYKKSSKLNTINKETAVTDVTNGLIEYFNVMLGSQLLYKFERPQYSEILEQYPGQQLSTIYGSVHLLRLFVKLGSMLAFTSLDEKSIQLLLVHLQDFLKYLVKNSSTLFSMQNFVNASPEYHRKAL